MRTPLVTEIGHHEHPPQPSITTTPDRLSEETIELRPVRRIGVIDRAALHLGVALIRWGRRPVRSSQRVRPTLSREAYEAQRQAEALRDEYRAMSMTQYR
jgi:hypothetical protein